MNTPPPLWSRIIAALAPNSRVARRVRLRRVKSERVARQKRLAALLAELAHGQD